MTPTEREIKIEQFTKKKMRVQVCVCVCVCVCKRLEGKSQSINKYFFVVKLLNHFSILQTVFHGYRPQLQNGALQTLFWIRCDPLGCEILWGADHKDPLWGTG